MKLNPNLILRPIGARFMIVDPVAESASDTNVYWLNSAAAELWQAVEGKEFTVETLAEVFRSQFEVGEVQALDDAREIAGEWLRHGLATE